jgi:hypothetical protein
VTDDALAAGRRHRLEIGSAVLLAVATVLAAWCAYQSTRWTGVMATAFSEANTNRAESIRLDTQGSSVITIDVQSFLAWIGAVRDRDGPSAAELRTRFRPEFKTVFEAWLGRAPGMTLSLADLPPGTPFDRPDYEPALLQTSDDLANAAELRFADARVANQTGDNYVLVAVLMSIGLFLAGTARQFRSMRLESVILGGAAMAVSIGIVACLLLPINIGI